MNQSPNTLFVGLGSPHGDDQIGWLVVDRLICVDDRPSGLVIRKATIPLDLLDWLDGIQRLVVCDAMEPTSTRVDLQHWTWCRAADKIPTGLLTQLFRVRTGNSHDYQLAEVLDLANRLDKLPPRIEIWGIPTIQCEYGHPISDELLDELSTICEDILSELMSK
ncbi:MAG: hydrogenase maturation protease [Planctomycetaceae bacterium]|nr:hydrogenase maturation protease [Planctomycetaceae bacterium]